MAKGDKFRWRTIDRAEEPKRSAAVRLRDFGETYRAYDEETAREQASRCVQCPNANCAAACPLEMPIPELLFLTSEGQFKEAAEMLFSTQSLPEFFAHICVEGRLCEAACVLGKNAEPVPIHAISRFLLDYGWKHGFAEPACAPPNGQQALVIGGGLCGLVAADALSRGGYKVTVLDSAERPGGRLVNGLPGFRVDRAVIEYRIELLRQRGVRFQMGLRCGEDLTLGELRHAFDAVFIGMGRAEPTPLYIPGAGLKGILPAYTFVLQETSNSPLSIPAIDVRGKRVVVLGGGETAMDALRVALRSGALEAIGLYRRDESNLPVNPAMYHDAVEEGARVHFLTQAIAAQGDENGNVVGLRCARTILENRENSDRGAPQVMVGSEFDVAADVVLVAYGFMPPKLPKGGQFDMLSVDERGCLLVDSNQMTNLPGVFAGGSIVRGPVALPSVVRDARNAAISIDRYLKAQRQG